MHFEGDFDVAASQERVFEIVTDPRQVAGCMPGLKKIDVKSAGAFDALIKIGAGFVKGDFAMRFKLEERTPPSRAKMIAHGTGLGSAVDLEIVVKIGEASKGRTSMNWAAEARVSGKLASIGQRLMESTAQKIIGQFFDCFREKLEGS